MAHREEGQAATFRTVVKEIITSKSSTPLLLGMCVWGERWGGGDCATIIDGPSTIARNQAGVVLN